MVYVEFWTALGLLCAISPEQRWPQSMDVSPRWSGIFQQSGAHSNSFSCWSWLGSVSRTHLDDLTPLLGGALNCEVPQQCREESGPPALFGYSLPSKPTCGRCWVKTLTAVLWRVRWACNGAGNNAKSEDPCCCHRTTFSCDSVVLAWIQKPQGGEDKGS